METRYFNFPVSLLKDFVLESFTKECLNNICDYAIYVQYQKLEYGNKKEKLKSVQNYFRMTLGDENRSLDNGSKLFFSLETELLKVGMNVNTWFDFYKNEKTEFEKLCLLAHLAFKSIVQNKPFIKIDNRFWFSRIAGFSKAVNTDELPEVLKKYLNEYQTKKIKNELRNNWGLVTYSRYTRGFYVSYQLNIEQLVFEAEKRRKAVKDKQQRVLENEAVKKALARLTNETRP